MVTHGDIQMATDETVQERGEDRKSQRPLLNRRMWQVEPQRSQSTEGQSSEACTQRQGKVQLLEELWRISAALQCSDN